MDIVSWLRELGLERYEQAFRDNEIDEAILPSLTTEDLKDLGVLLVGHRRRLLNAIAALDQQDAKTGHAETTASLEPTQPVSTTIAESAEAERRQLTVMALKTPCSS